MAEIDQIIDATIEAMKVETTAMRRAILRGLLNAVCDTQEELRRAETDRCIRAARAVLGDQPARALQAVLAGGEP